MLITLFGNSCTGKSTAADAIKSRIGATVYTGKDYTRLAKNEDEAKRLFTMLLSDAVNSDGHVIYVVSEREHLTLVPDGALRVYFSAPIDVIKERFAARTGGRLPPPLADMLERKQSLFDDTPFSLSIDSGTTEDAVSAILEVLP